MVDQHRPRFKLPDAFLGEGQEHPLQQIALSRGVEQVLLMQRAGGDEVDAVFAQPMDWGVGPETRLPS